MATLWTTCPQRGGGQMHQLSQSQMMAAGYIPCSAYLKSWKHSGCQSRRRNQSRKNGGENRSPKIPILNQNVHGDGRGKMQASLPEVYSPTDWETFILILSLIFLLFSSSFVSPYKAPNTVTLFVTSPILFWNPSLFVYIIFSKSLI